MSGAMHIRPVSIITPSAAMPNSETMRLRLPFISRRMFLR